MRYEQIMEHQKKRLIELIREVSNLHGGDDAEFLDEYIAAVLKEWSNKLHTAILCFEGLRDQALCLNIRRK